MFAKDLMTAPVISVTQDIGIRAAIQLMLEKDVSGLPAVDGNGALCGMITEGDLLKKSMSRSSKRQPPEIIDQAFFEDYVRAHGTAVSDCMTKEVVSVSPEEPLSAVASLMQARNIRHVPVVDHGKLVGVVSRRDVLKAVTSGRDVTAEGQDALRLAVATRLHQELGLKPGDFAIAASGSIIEFIESGNEPAKRRAMELVAESVAGVAGVVFRSRSGGLHS